MPIRDCARATGIVLAVLLGAIAPSALGQTVHGGITISPSTPAAGQAVTITLANTFGAEAHADSASITQSGNVFTIQQNVSIACSLPSDPTVRSDFVVGPLAPGAYQVIANISFTGSLCESPPPVTQNTSFVVVASVPLFSTRTLVALAAMLALGAVMIIKG